MKENKFVKMSRKLFLSYVFLVELFCWCSTAVYKGCYPETPASRQLAANPGNYYTNNMFINLCNTQCTTLGYSYAGLTSGELCFCGNTLTEASVSEGLCNLPCTGQPAESCGSNSAYMNVHQLLVPWLSSLSIQYPGIIETYNSTTFTFNVTGGNVVTISGSLTDSDRHFTLPPSDTMLQHSIKTPGISVIKARASDSLNVTVTASAVIQAQTHIKGVILGCPSVVASGTRFDCYMTIAQGTSISIEADIGDGTLLPLRTPDCPSYTTGHSSGFVSGISHPGTSLLYLVSGAEFRQNGTIVGFSYTAELAGTITVQVYRPFCSNGGEVFCHKSYSCISSNDTCYHQPVGEQWKHRCRPGAIYSIAKKYCVDSATGQMDENSTNKAYFGSFDLIGEVLVVISAVGQNFYQVPDSDLLSVQAGDFLAVKEDSAKLQLINTTSSTYEYYFDVHSDSAWSNRASNGYTLMFASSDPTLAAAHAICAHVVRPVRLKFRHTYIEQDFITRNISVSASNNISSLIAIGSINVHSLVENVTIFFNRTAAMTNSTVVLLVPPHPGSYVIYYWDFDDGNTSVGANSSVEHLWTTDGVYNITLLAVNNFSSSVASLILIVQDEIKDLTATTLGIAAVRFTPFLITWNISQGTEVNFMADMGDGIIYNFNSSYFGTNDTTTNCTDGNGTANCAEMAVSSASEFEGYLWHNYTSAGEFLVQILGANLASSLYVNFSLPVQVIIENFTIHDINPIPYGQMTTNMMLSVDAGSDMNVSVVFGNRTLDTAYILDSGSGVAVIRDSDYYGYGYYIVYGIISNLVSPVENFTTGVWVDYLITDLTVTIDRLFLPVLEVTSLYVEMSWCSRFNTTISYDDGTPNVTFYSDLLLSPDNVTSSHSYALPGTYNVSLEIVNPVDYFTDTYTVLVQYPVANLDSTSTTPHVLLFGLSVYVPFNLTFLGGVEPATEAIITVDFQDGMVTVDPFNVTDQDPVVFAMMHAYSSAGTYNVSMNVSNLVSWITLYEVVDIDEMIYDLELTSDPMYVITNQHANFQASMSGGTRAICRWNFQDGSVDHTEWCSKSDSAMVNHTFVSPGVYNVHLFANNSVSHQSTLSLNGSVIVQNPVTSFTTISLTKASYIGPPYTADYSVTHSFEVLFNNSNQLPTNASYQIHFGDGTVSSIQLLPTTVQAVNHVPNQDLILSFSHTYIRGGNYSVDVTIWNLVSQETYSDTFDIYEVISNLQVTAYDFDEVTNIKKAGGGSNYDYFAQEHYVWFQASYDRGSHMTFNWIYDDMTSDSIFYQDYTLHRYTNTGSYYVQLYASNIIGTANVNVSIHVHRGCFDIAISGNTPRPKNTTFDFPVYPGSIATDGCYMIDFVEETAIPSRYQFFGDYSYCSSIPEWASLLAANVDHFIHLSSSEWENRRYLHLNPPTTTTVSTSSLSSTGSTTSTTSSTTSTTGSTVTVFTSFTGTTPFASSTTTSTTTSSTTTSTTAVPSTTTTATLSTTTVSPESIAKWNETIWTIYMLPGLYETVLTCKNRVSEESSTWLTGVTKGQCWWPYVNLTTPNICDPPFCDSEYPDMRSAYRSEKLIVYSDVKINCTATKIAYYWWRVFKQNADWGNETEITDLKSADIFSIGARNLILEGNTLEYGLYRFWLNASMDELMGMYTTDNVYLRIIATPLVVEIAGGEFITRRWGDLVPLQVNASLSYDPDTEDPGDKTGMEFIWLCRRLCEGWPQKYDKDFNVKRRMPQNNCTYQDPSDRGCNKIDMFDSSGK